MKFNGPGKLGHVTDLIASHASYTSHASSPFFDPLTHMTFMTFLTCFPDCHFDYLPIAHLKLLLTNLFNTGAD